MQKSNSFLAIFVGYFASLLFSLGMYYDHDGHGTVGAWGHSQMALLIPMVFACLLAWGLHHRQQAQMAREAEAKERAERRTEQDRASSFVADAAKIVREMLAQVPKSPDKVRVLVESGLEDGQHLSEESSFVTAQEMADIVAKKAQTMGLEENKRLLRQCGKADEWTPVKTALLTLQKKIKARDGVE